MYRSRHNHRHNLYVVFVSIINHISGILAMLLSQRHTVSQSRDVTGSSISGGRSLTVSIIHNIDAARLYNEVRHLDVNKRRENNYKTWKHQVTIVVHIFCDVNLET